MGITILWADSEYYPERLININDPPVLLYVKGNPGCRISNTTCAAIGTRQPSSYGIRCARLLGAFLGSKGFVVVSGLARGCDTAAHQGCVEVSGRTVAVLAHGLDRIYPAENRDLADQIVSTGGCLVSEHQPGVGTSKHGFVERNRIQSGLSSGLIVIEAGIEGGVMHTVRFGLEQGRPIACIQHPQEMVSFSKAKGNERLIAEGKAAPLNGQEDIDAFLLKISGPEVRSNHEDKTPSREIKKYLQPTLW
jgi:DNA processing protein